MFTVKFRTNGEAFSDDAEEEIGRILERIAGQVRMGRSAGHVYDYNGNTIGAWSRT